MKKFKLILFVTFGGMIVLQLFFDRDFSQLKYAFAKYQHQGTLSQLTGDIKSIFAGGRINLNGLAVSQLKERVIYVWTDAEGVVHNSERKPKDADFKVVKMGAGLISSQKALSKEEIQKQLKAKPKL
ncbi:MAG: hypothetical protein Q9M92_11465 [Enterobacterales bacterium]|nr:hypothetical protein [Enterobacterales bacterium]